MKHRGVAAAICCLSAIVPVNASYESGSKLLGYCQSEQGRLPYIDGFLAGYTVAVHDYGASVSASAPQFCVPKSATVGQVRDVVCKYLASHPAGRHSTGAPLVARAFSEAWPCAGQ